MRRTVTLILATLMLALPALAADKPQPQKRVTMEFYGLALSHLLDLLANGFGISYAVVPPQLAQKPITINAAGSGPVDLQGALGLLRAAGIDNMRTGDTYVFYARPGTALAAPEPVVTPPPAGRQPKVNLDFRDAPLEDALRVTFRDTPYSFAFGPDVRGAQHVTLSLQDVPFSTALQVIAQAANVDIVREPGAGDVYSIRSRPSPVVSMGGAQIPVVGAVAVGPGAGGGGMAGGGGGGFSGVFPSSMDAAELLSSLDRARALTVPTVEVGGKLVDLDVKDMPIREAMARFSEASGSDVIVHPAVSNEIKVTVRAFAVPPDWLLRTIASQSHLGVVTEIIPQPAPPPSAEPAESRPLPPRYRYHLVPPLEIKVTGAPTAAGGPVLPPAAVAPPSRIEVVPPK